MIINTDQKSAAAPNEAGYSPAKSTPDLARAWLIFCIEPGRESENVLASHLDALFKKWLPDGRCKGVIKGREGDVRQEAYLRLIGKNLAANSELLAATASGDVEEIENQIEKSLNTTIKIVSSRFIKQAKRHLKLHEYGRDIDICQLAVYGHPADRKSLGELPFEIQRKMVFAALRMGLETGLFCTINTDVALSMVGEGQSQSQIAKALGISRQAVHGRLNPIRKHLQEILETLEFPLS